MCAVCYTQVRAEDAFTDPAGDRWDMCQTCGNRENQK